MVQHTWPCIVFHSGPKHQLFVQKLRTPESWADLPIKTQDLEQTAPIALQQCGNLETLKKLPKKYRGRCRPRTLIGRLQEWKAICSKEIDGEIFCHWIPKFPDSLPEVSWIVGLEKLCKHEVDHISAQETKIQESTGAIETKIDVQDGHFKTFLRIPKVPGCLHSLASHLVNRIQFQWYPQMILWFLNYMWMSQIDFSHRRVFK